MHITPQDREKLKPWLDDDFKEKISEQLECHRKTVERVLNNGVKNEEVVKAIRTMAKTNKSIYDFEPEPIES